MEPKLKLNIHKLPRIFSPSSKSKARITDCGTISLLPDEMVTFVTESAKEYDLVRKTWGFYATPSINGRLHSFGWKTALIKGEDKKYYIFLVEIEKLDDFSKYISQEGHELMEWLDERDN